MPLYVGAFTEHGGYAYRCRIRAAADADHLTLAVQKVWGAACSWSWVPASDTDGRVYERRGTAEAADDVPRTGRTSVQVLPARRTRQRGGQTGARDAPG